MRSKETSDDYRYFPEPDLPPLHVDPAWLDELRAGLPELPAARRARYRDGARADAPTTPAVLVADPDATALFEATLAADPAARRRSRSRTGSPGSTCACATRRSRRPVERRAGRARGARRARSRTGRSRARNAQGGPRGPRRRPGEPAAAIIAARGFRQITDADALGAAVDEVLAANPAAVADYRAGKDQAVGFLVGQVMKATRGQANAALGAGGRPRAARRRTGEG